MFAAWDRSIERLVNFIHYCYAAITRTVGDMEIVLLEITMGLELSPALETAMPQALQMHDDTFFKNQN